MNRCPGASATLGLLTMLVWACGSEPDPVEVETPDPPAPANIEISVATEGVDADLDGYVARLEGSGTTVRRRRIPAGGSSAGVFSVESGAYEVTLEDLAGNCEVTGRPSPSTMDVSEGETVRIAFVVTCTEIPPLYDRILVAVAAGGTEPVGLYSMALDGSDRRRLTFPAFPAWDNHPHVSPDGKRIVFVRHDPSADFSSSIRIANADGKEDPGVLQRGEWPRWSPEGDMIAWARGTPGLPDIRLIRPDSSGFTNLTRTRAWPDVQPEWAPDGTRIAFVRARDDEGTRNIYTIGRDGEGLSRLTHGDRGIDGIPAWSPDGRQIAFTSSRNGSYRVYLINVDGTDLVQLVPDTPAHGEGCDTCGDFVQAWSPDGTHILFKRRFRSLGQPPELFLFDLETRTETPITDNDSDDHSATFAPATPTGHG